VRPSLPSRGVDSSEKGLTVTRHDVIVVGASAGGVESLVQLVGGLPAQFDAALCVVLHVPIDVQSHLPSILARAGPLKADHAVDGAPIHRGRIYVAPPNHHLTLAGGTMRLTVGPRINSVRPSIDVLFRSAARAFGARTIGVVLSGTLRDGTLGLDAIKLRGGVTIVQDPEEARFSSMPRSAMTGHAVDHIAPIDQISRLLVDLTSSAAVSPPSSRAVTMTSDPTNDLNDIIVDDQETTAAFAQKTYDHASGLTCPNCHGSVWEVEDGTMTRIECRVGHAFSIDAFLGEQAVTLEDALWSAINALQERADTLRRFSVRFRTANAVESYAERAHEVERHVTLLREGLMRVIQADTAASAADERAS